MPQGRTKALLTIRGRQKGCVWNSSHRIRQKSDLSIATAIIQRIVETGKNNGPGLNSSRCHHERSGRGNEPFRIDLVSAWATNDQNVICFRTRLITGNPGSLCVGKYREHMRRSLGLKIC